MEDSFTSLPTESGEVRVSGKPHDTSARQDVGIFVPSNSNRGARNMYTDWPVIISIAAALEKAVRECGVCETPPSDRLGRTAEDIRMLINLLSGPAKESLTSFIETLHHKLQDGRSQ